EERVVDVGDVLDVAHLTPGVGPRPDEQVEPEVGVRVTEVGRVVGGDPADVERRGALGPRRDELTRARLGEADLLTAAGERGDDGSRPGAHVRKPNRQATVTRTRLRHGSSTSSVRPSSANCRPLVRRRSVSAPRSSASGRTMSTTPRPRAGTRGPAPALFHVFIAMWWWYPPAETNRALGISKVASKPRVST